MGTAWLVRAGQESRHAGAFEAAGAVALGWTNISGLNDLEGLTAARIAELVRAFGRAPLPAAQDAAELIAFRDELAVGDLVVTPDARVRQVLVGTVASDYRYDEGTPVADYRHVRDVEWQGRIERDALREPLRKDTKLSPDVALSGQQPRCVVRPSRAHSIWRSGSRSSSRPSRHEGEGREGIRHPDRS